MTANGITCEVKQYNTASSIATLFGKDATFSSEAEYLKDCSNPDQLQRVVNVFEFTFNIAPVAAASTETGTDSFGNTCNIYIYTISYKMTCANGYTETDSFKVKQLADGAMGGYFFYLP